MVEYHGWITLREATHYVDEDRLEGIAASVQQELDRRNTEHRVVGMRVVNSIYVMWLAGCTNHWSSDINDVFELFVHIAGLAPGSYGLLYLWDDEDLQHENEFRVWRLAKGVLTEQADPFLSPCIPTIEDEE